MSNNYGPIHLNRDTDEVTISRKRFNALCDTAAERDAALAEAAAHKAEAERLRGLLQLPDESVMRAVWESVKATLEPKTWTVGESATYFGFFSHGWFSYWKRQRVHALAATPTAKET